MPFPTCPKPLFQSDAKCKDIGVKVIFYSYVNKTKKGFRLGLVSKVIFTCY